MAEINEFNLSDLQSRIKKLKDESNQTSEDTLQYIHCLMDAHDLRNSIPEDIQIDEIPDFIFQKLRAGEIPTKEELVILDPRVQYGLCTELVFLCGMKRLKRIGGESKAEDSEYSMCELVEIMRDISIPYCQAAYILMAMILLMSSIPSPKLIENIVQNFDESEEQVEQNARTFQEFSSAILTKYEFDTQNLDFSRQ